MPSPPLWGTSPIGRGKATLYTREPGCFRTSESVGIDALIDPSYLLVDFSLGPMKGIGPYKNSSGCPKTIL